eukprot:146361_1
MVGLYFAGKTTILYKLKLGPKSDIKTIPTIGFGVESVELDDLDIIVWEAGGQDKILTTWRHYYQNLECLIWVIDSNNKTTIRDKNDSHTEYSKH